MLPHEYSELDGTALAALILAREVSAAEVEAVARSSLADVDADLNALTGPAYDRALPADPHGPFAGVPFLIKDSGPFARGTSFSLGSRSVSGAAAVEDHPLMARFRAAGLSTLGQTTAPEWSLSFATESRRYGATRNPWALDRGTGGSSGGAAAMVAARAVPLAHASDGAGSLRIPASACGLVGLKPGHGVTPGAPRSGLPGRPLGVHFVLARSVRDAAGLLDAVGTDRPADDRAYATQTRRDPGRLRVAVTTEAAATVDPRVVAATSAVAQTLEWIGHLVAEGAPTVNPEDVLDAVVLEAMRVGAAVRAAPVQPRVELLEAVSRRILSESLVFPHERVEASVAAQNRVTAAVDDFFDRTDLLVTPTLASLPARHGELDYDDPRFDDGTRSVRDWFRGMFHYGPFTAVFNVSGHPAISLPLGESSSGVPIGVQLVAGAGREGLLLGVAAQLEQAMPWRDRSPSVRFG